MTDTLVTVHATDAGQTASPWSVVGSIIANLALIAFGLMIGAIIGLLVVGAAGWLPALEC